MGLLLNIPGHGLSKFDTHFQLPFISNNLNYLEKNDFSLFKNKKSLFAMTAHIVFNNLDENNCITHSKKAIN